MSVIDIFPHYYIGNFLDMPLYLPRNKIKYLNKNIDSSFIILGDDSVSNPIIYEIRDLIANYFLGIDELTTEDFTYYSNIRAKSKTIETGVSYNQINSIVNAIKKLKLTQLEKEIVPEMFIKMSIGAFIIHNYPQLLTKKENKHKKRYNLFLYNHNRVEKVELTDRSLTTGKDLLSL